MNHLRRILTSNNLKDVRGSSQLMQELLAIQNRLNSLMFNQAQALLEQIENLEEKIRSIYLTQVNRQLNEVAGNRKVETSPTYFRDRKSSLSRMMGIIESSI